MAMNNGTIAVNKLDEVRDAFKAVTSPSLHFMLQDERTLKILSTGDIIDVTTYRFYIIDASRRSATPHVFGPEPHVFSPDEILSLAYKHREGGYQEFEGALAGFEDLRRKACSARNFVIFRKIGGLLRQIA